MIKKGIILAGGKGTRMSPLTKAVNKQLLPIYDKPLIFYPLSILMLANIKDILIIVNKGQLNQYKKIIPNGNNLGIKITYLEQDRPRGLPDAFVIGEKFIGKENVAMILGDNFFYGQNLTSKLLENTKLKKGARVVLHKVSKPEIFGVAKIDKRNKIVSIKEKPKKFLSDLAITGLYFFDNKVINYAKKLKPSKRGELEITDINKSLLNLNKLKVQILRRGMAWLDTGTFDSLQEASSFIKTIEKRQGLKIGCPEEIAWKLNYIDDIQLEKIAKKYLSSSYGLYLMKLLENNK